MGKIVKAEIAAIETPPSLSEPDGIYVSVENVSDDFIFEAKGLNSYFIIRVSPKVAHEFARRILEEDR